MLSGTANHKEFVIHGYDPIREVPTVHRFYCDSQSQCNAVLLELLRQSSCDIVQLLGDYELDSEFLLEQMGAEPV